VVKETEFAKYSAGVEAMMAAFWSPRSNSSVGRQVVFGYIRMPSPRPRYVMAVRTRFAVYCQERMLRVGRVFIDDCVPDSTSMDRPAFAQLWKLCKQEQPNAVLLLSAKDLSRDAAVALELAERIWLTGTQIYCVRGEPPIPGTHPGSVRPPS
jgi:hypothetical protein